MFLTDYIVGRDIPVKGCGTQGYNRHIYLIVVHQVSTRICWIWILQRVHQRGDIVNGGTPGDGRRYNRYMLE